MIAIVRVKGKKGKKEYGEKISVPRESIFDGSIFDKMEDIICRVGGASVLYGDDKVEVEISEGDKIFVLEGYPEIERKLKEYEFLKKIFNL